MHPVIKKTPEWLRSTSTQALRGWLRFLAIWVPATALFAIWRVGSGAAEPIELGSLVWLIPMTALVTYAGAFAFAAAAPLRRRRHGYYPAWALAGSVALVVAVALLWGGGLVLGEDTAFFTAPWVWFGAVAGGAFTGAGYGWEARRSGLWGAEESSDGNM